MRLRSTGYFSSLGLILMMTLGLIAPQVHADDEVVSDEVLRKVQTGLIDVNSRKAMIGGDSRAQEQDRKVNDLFGGDTTQAYMLSAELLEAIHKKAGGKQDKIQELVNELTSNPQLIEQYLTPDQKAQIRGLAGGIESRQKQGPKSGRSP